MKKLLLSVSTLVLCNALNAQTGNVGINTQNPTENLNVNGTFRVNELPTNGQKINTTASGSLSSSKNQNFAPTKMVVVDNNGVFGKADIPSSGGTYSGSTSIKLDGTSFKRMALTGDATALENSNATKVVAIQGKPVATTAPTANQVLQWKNNAWTPSTLDIPEVPKDPVSGTGSVIAIGGKLQIAEEITATMANKTFDVSQYGGSAEIPHLTTVEVNNKKLFNPSTSGNTFQVSENGQYQIMMNVLIRNAGGNPVIGVWNNNTDQWVARVSNGSDSTRQVYTLITVVPLTAGTTYSFRVARGQSDRIYKTIVEGYNGGTTGSGPATFVSVKRVR